MFYNVPVNFPLCDNRKNKQINIQKENKKSLQTYSQ
jgi:hypothetical protein